MITIQKSVGKSGFNLVKDVRKIQLALLQAGFLSPKDFNQECLDLTIETPILDLRGDILAGDKASSLNDIIEGNARVGEGQLQATIKAIIKLQTDFVVFTQPSGNVEPDGRSLRQLEVLAQRVIKERNLDAVSDIDVVEDEIALTLRVEGKEHIKNFSVQACRAYLIKTWNWNGILKCMQWVYQQKGEKYLVSNNLSGTESDDVLIIPAQAIMYIIELQLQYAIDKLGLKSANVARILQQVDGLAGKGFITKIIKAKSKANFFDESHNKRLTRIEDDIPIIIPGLDSDQESLYQFFRDIVRARNGLWSDKPGIVNVVGFRRRLDQLEKTKYNDTIAVCWLYADENGMLCPNVEVNIASTEPGNRKNARQLVPQTMTLVPGYHHIRQPAGRTRNAVKMGKNKGALVWEDTIDTTMNFHQGRNNFKYPKNNKTGSQNNWLSEHGLWGNQQKGFPSGGFDQLALHQLNLVFSEIYLILSKYGEGKENPPYQNLANMCGKPALTNEGIKGNNIVISWKKNSSKSKKLIDIKKAKQWMLLYWTNKQKEEERFKFTLILEKLGVFEKDNGSKWQSMTKAKLAEKIKEEHISVVVDWQIKYEADPKHIDGRAGETFLKMISRIRQSLSQAERDKKRLDLLFERLNDYPLRNVSRLVQKIKTHFQLNTDKNRLEVQQLAETLPDFEVDVMQHATVGTYSLGCQIIYDTEVFYTFWTNLLARAAKVGQLRWYYTLIDATDLKKSDLIA